MNNFASLHCLTAHTRMPRILGISHWPAYQPLISLNVAFYHMILYVQLYDIVLYCDIERWFER